MRARQLAPKLIAEAFLAGNRDEASATTRIHQVITASPRAISGLVRRLGAKFSAAARPRTSRVAQFIQADAGFCRLSAKETFTVNPAVQWPREMRPVAGPPSTWPVRPILTVGDLARLLNLTPSELNWFAERRSLHTKTQIEQLRHYHYRWIQKRRGSARLIESPKPRLKAIQRFLLSEIIERIPAHEAAHGFRKGRSIATFTPQHVGRRLVLKLDLKDFFVSLTRGRVRAIFLTAGYPEPVAEVLSALCVTITPPDIVRACPAPLDFTARSKFREPHLPQGAPTSPALANLCVFRLDCRLAGLAHSAGAHYTRYADDLLFSGDEEFARSARRFYIAACRVALEEGFEINTRKTRLMHRSASQRAVGLVLNEKMNIPRREYDILKATLHNCLTKGIATQTNMEPESFLHHLRGRVSHFEMVNPARAQKLRAMLSLLSAHGRP